MENKETIYINEAVENGEIQYLREKGVKREYMLYEELPILIRKIILNSTLPLPADINMVKREIEEIKKITNTECNSALSYLKDLGVS